VEYFFLDMWCNITFISAMSWGGTGVGRNSTSFVFAYCYDTVQCTWKCSSPKVSVPSPSWMVSWQVLWNNTFSWIASPRTSQHNCPLKNPCDGKISREIKFHYYWTPAKFLAIQWWEMFPLQKVCNLVLDEEEKMRGIQICSFLFVLPPYRKKLFLISTIPIIFKIIFTPFVGILLLQKFFIEVFLYQITIIFCLYGKVTGSSKVW
jgi:hypothetical protein